MDECPTMEELLAHVDGSRTDQAIEGHIQVCRDACLPAIAALERQVHGLSMSLSGIWFRERISCPSAAELDAFRAGGLGQAARRYVEFHMEELGCLACEGQLGLGEAAEGRAGREALDRSRSHVGDETAHCLAVARRRT